MSYFLKNLLLLTTLFLLPLCAAGQRQALSSDLLFFQTRAAVYQRWLDNAGLGKVLKVDAVKLKDGDDTELELHLLMRATDPDSAASVWRQINLDTKNWTGDTLPALLFRRFLFMMEIPADQGDIQIYLKNQKGYDLPCFYVGIWGDEAQVQSKQKTENCRAQPIDFQVPPTLLKNTLRGKATEIRKTRTPQQVYDDLCTYFNSNFPWNKYVGTDCSGHVPKVECRMEGTRFIITVSDLCREVLTRSENSVWCKIARHLNPKSDCNDMRREFIEFDFHYFPDIGGGFRLNGALTGKVGSAVYLPRTLNDWFLMDPDFLSYEQAFAQRFMPDLQAWLSKR